MKNLFKPLCQCFLLLAVTYNISIGQINNNLFDITPYVGSKYFYWGEYDEYTTQNLEEYGLLYLFGIEGKTKFSKNLDLYITTDVNAYYGIVDYNGYLQDANGNTEPYNSETTYWGLEFLINAGYDIYLDDNFVLAPELGFGYEYWERDIDNGGQYGYDEIWDLFLFNFGYNFIVYLPQSSKIFLKILGKYPIKISESIDLESRGQGGPANINLEPISNIGVNLELGSVIYGAFFSTYLDYSFYSKSDFDQNYHQPESEKTLIGIKLGYNF